MTVAAAALIGASARDQRALDGVPEIGKFSTARWVCARHLAAGRDPHLAHRVVLDAVVRSGTGSGAVLSCGHAALPCREVTSRRSTLDAPAEAAERALRRILR